MANSPPTPALPATPSDLPIEVDEPSVEAPIALETSYHAQVRATRRDYDYFSELDEKLERLQEESEATPDVLTDI